MHEYRITIWLLCFVKVFGCDVGQFQLASSCYGFVMPAQNLTWMDTFKNCIDGGGSLVSFETESEQDALRNYWYTRYKADEKFYIGLYSQGIKTMWLSNSDPSYERWSPNTAPQRDSCEGTVLDIKNNNWLRVMCTIRYQQIGYICEYNYGVPRKPRDISTITPINTMIPVGTKTQQTNDLTVACPLDNFVYGNSCYEVVADPNTHNWTYAVNRCSEKGGQLVSLETEDEHNAIINSLKKKYLYVELFIGLRYPKDGGSAMWLSGASLTYDRHGENNSNFKCTTIFAFHSIWFARPCDPGIPVANGYICEYTRETMPFADVTVLVTSGIATTDITSVLRVMNGDGNNLKIGVLISVIVVLLVLIIVAIIFRWKWRKVGKQDITPSGPVTNTDVAEDANEALTQQDIDVPPVYMQLQTPDIIRETPNCLGSTRLEINIQPSYATVDEGGSYCEIRKNSKDTDSVSKERFISRNISRAKTVFRMSGRKRFADQKQGKKDIKTNRPQSCKPHYIAGQERAFYAQSNVGFSQNTLPNKGSCSEANEHFYNKPIYDECGRLPDNEQIYSLPCADTLASKSNQCNPTAVDFQTDHYYSSMTDPTNAHSVQVAPSDGVYFVLEQPDVSEVVNEIYESGPE